MEARISKTLPKLGLGIGLDLPWASDKGFVAGEEGDDAPHASVTRFFESQGADFAHVFVSWQPRGRSRLRLGDYAEAWDALFGSPGFPIRRALHHTALNLGEGTKRDRSELFDFTNALVDRYRLRWINEDVGVWSLFGKPLPYPFPPYLTHAGLRAAVGNTRECQSALVAPLVIEFPGFSEGTNIVLGDMDAYDFFRRLAEETGAPVTLDIGHLLSWRWLIGHRGEGLLDGLERLPLTQCFEIHLSGCHIGKGGRFIDAHDGALMVEQLKMLGQLLCLCPNLKAVTFEDPIILSDGSLSPSSARAHAALNELMRPWTS